MNYVPYSITPDQILVLVYDELVADIRAGKRVMCGSYRDGDGYFGKPGYTFCSFPDNLGALYWNRFIRSTSSYATYTLAPIALQRAARLASDPTFERFEIPDDWYQAAIDAQNAAEAYEAALEAWRRRPWWRKLQRRPQAPFSPLGYSQCRAYSDWMAEDEKQFDGQDICLTCFGTEISSYNEKPFPCEHCKADEYRAAVDAYWSDC